MIQASRDTTRPGIHLIGISAATGWKLLLTIALVVVVFLVLSAIRALLKRVFRSPRFERAVFWTRHVLRLVGLLVLALGLASIWFDDPARLTSFIGIVTAGVAIASQRVITAFAAYLIILAGRIFARGDRIVIGKVRGDVIALGFMQTTVMEMGQTSGEQGDDPSVWVHARQYTGRIVRVTNDRIFDSPVYNYTREFPYLWEELIVPIKYGADRARAEAILLEVAEKHTASLQQASAPALEALKERYPLREETSVRPRVFWRLTDNWVELTVRFIAPQHGARALKDAMSRDILAALDAAKLEVASATYEIIGLPPLVVRGEATQMIPHDRQS